MKLTRIEGVEQVLRNLTRSSAKIGDRIAPGLVKAGVFLQRESQAIVPVQMGVLRNSAFTRRFGAGLRTEVIVGYTVKYAALVHENPNAAHGQAFNVKHAAKIARAGRMTTTKSGRQRWRPTSAAGTAKGGMFPRGENQQFKFLENPAKNKRSEMFKIIASAAK